MTDTSRRYWLALALVGVAAVWGATFVMVKDAVELYPLYGFLGWRFAIAVVAFLVLFPRSLKRFEPGTLRVGLLAGAFLTAGYIFQTWGLQDTSASKAAFITGMFVVITPVMQTVILRRMPRWPTTVGIVVSVLGLWLLSGATADGWNVGDTRVLACAVAYSAHMIVLGSLGREHDVGALTLVQLSVGAVVCGAISLAFERPGIPSDALGVDRLAGHRRVGNSGRVRSPDRGAASDIAGQDGAHPDHRTGVRGSLRLACW